MYLLASVSSALARRGTTAGPDSRHVLCQQNFAITNFQDGDSSDKPGGPILLCPVIIEA